MYLPDLPTPAYQDLIDSLVREFTYTFGGCTSVSDLAGSYLSRHGLIIQDPIRLVFTDTTLLLTEDLERISHYADHLRQSAFLAVNEEAILVVAFPVYHSE